MYALDHMAKGPNKRCTIGYSGSMQKTRSSSVDKFLPGLAAQGVLEIGDTFPVTISEQFPEDGVICNAWVLHIAKVGSIPSPYLGNVEEQKS